MKNWMVAIAAGLAALVAYLLLWPVPIEPVSISVPAAPGYTGVHAANTRLANAQRIDLGGAKGPEHIVFGPDGKLYTGVQGGNILRMQPDGSAQEVLANTGGHPLGLVFDAAGNLLVADAEKGLLSVSPQGAVSVLLSSFEGKPLQFADALVVAQDGTVYFSDASTRFGPLAWGGVHHASMVDLLEGSGTGRILAFDPVAKSTRIVARGLMFANGVALSSDQKHLFVNETGRFRVWKIAVEAKDLDVRQAEASPASPLARVLLDNLPGYPDNLMRGLDGKIWLGLVSPRSPDADLLADKPFVRKILMRLPRALWPIPKPFGHVMAFTEDGRIVADLQDPQGSIPATTGVTETKDRLYIQSLQAKSFGWLAKP